MGLVRPEHSEMSLIGFGLLFLLGITLINGNVEVSNGNNVTIQNSYSTYNGTAVLNSSVETTTITYSNFNDDNSHNFGYWISILAAFGICIVLIGLRRGKKDE